MKIKNGKGEITLTPKSKSKEEIKKKFRGKSVSTLSQSERNELIEQVAKDLGYI